MCYVLSLYLFINNNPENAQIHASSRTTQFNDENRRCHNVRSKIVKYEQIFSSISVLRLGVRELMH